MHLQYRHDLGRDWDRRRLDVVAHQLLHLLHLVNGMGLMM